MKASCLCGHHKKNVSGGSPPFVISTIRQGGRIGSSATHHASHARSACALWGNPEVLNGCRPTQATTDIPLCARGSHPSGLVGASEADMPLRSCIGEQGWFRHPSWSDLLNASKMALSVGWVGEVDTDAMMVRGKFGAVVRAPRCCTRRFKTSTRC